MNEESKQFVSKNEFYVSIGVVFLFLGLSLNFSTDDSLGFYLISAPCILLGFSYIIRARKYKKNI
jgi:hypothetical protein